MNTATTKQNPALAALRHHVSGAIERGEKTAIVGIPVPDERTDHERINRVLFTEAQRKRVESERPADGVPIPTDSGWMLAAYRMPNGSRFVTLVNGSEAVWQAYCAEVRVRKGIAQPGDADRALGGEFTHAEKVAVWHPE